MVEKGTVPNRAWYTKSTVPKEGMAELGFLYGRLVRKRYQTLRFCVPLSFFQHRPCGQRNVAISQVQVYLEIRPASKQEYSSTPVDG